MAAVTLQPTDRKWNLVRDRQIQSQGAVSAFASASCTQRWVFVVNRPPNFIQVELLLYSAEKKILKKKQNYKFVLSN